MKRTLQAAIAAVLVTAAFFALRRYLAPSASRPNIVLIIIDTLRADKLGAYGFSPSVSPELDRYAAEGAMFEQAYSQSSWTRASVGSFLTSHYPRSIGIRKEKWDALPMEVETLAEVLKAEGYYTIGVTANPQINSAFRFDQGFCEYADSNVIFGWMKREAGKDRAAKGVRLPRADDVFKKGLELAKNAGRRPVYLQVLIMEVHGSWKLKSEDVEPAISGLQDGRYLQSVKLASRQVGGFLERLLAQPGWLNTLVVITADHGEGLSDHPAVPHSRRHGNLLYDSQIHVPLILYNPSDQRLGGRRVRGAVPMLDLMPTVLEYAKIQAPSGIKGKSLLPLIENGAGASPGEPVFAETAWRKVDKTAVVYGDWKYIENRDKWPSLPPAELQLLQGRENGSATDQSAKPENGPILGRLRELLRGWSGATPVRRADEQGAEPSPVEIEQLKSLGYL